MLSTLKGSSPPVSQAEVKVFPSICNLRSFNKILQIDCKPPACKLSCSAIKPQLFRYVWGTSRGAWIALTHLCFRKLLCFITSADTVEPRYWSDSGWQGKIHSSLQKNLKKVESQWIKVFEKSCYQQLVKEIPTENLPHCLQLSGQEQTLLPNQLRWDQSIDFEICRLGSFYLMLYNTVCSWLAVLFETINNLRNWHH